MVHVRVGNNDVFDFGPLLVGQSNRDTAGVNRHAVVD
jgi:hypothetical protein